MKQFKAVMEDFWLPLVLLVIVILVALDLAKVI